MSHRVTHRTGEMESGFPIGRFGDLLDELVTPDDEHPDVSVTHESEWSLSVYTSGFVVLENLEAGEPQHLGPVDHSTALELMMVVAQGKVDALKTRPWRPGYPPRTDG